jgi:putative ABC transport system permease protein
MPFFEGMGAGLRHFVRNLLRRDRVERELTDEIDGYLDLLTEEKVAQGMSRDDARQTARLEIGRVDQVREHVRDVRVGAWLDALRQDVHFGVRTLIRRPAFTTVAVLTLGVGMGATTAIFSLIDSVLLKPLPFYEPDRLTMVWEVRPRFNQPRIEAAPLNYVDWQQQVQAFESLAAYINAFPYTALIGSSGVRVEGRPGPSGRSNAAFFRYVTPDYLNTIGVPLLNGRGFSDRDAGLPAALISERVTAFFDGDPVGQRIAFGPASMTVVGVVGDIKGEGLDVPNTRGTVYVPAGQLDQIGFFSPRALAIRTTSNPLALVTAVQREIWAVNPDQTIDNVRTLESIVEGQISDRKVQTGLFTAFAGLALFMAALGVYGLISFVVTSRTRELGVRAAMGAQRGDLVSLIARDSAVWVACGLVGGLALAMIVSRSMSSLIYGVEPLDWVSLASSSVVLATVAGLAALLPVWRATRVDPMTVLRAE